MVRWDFSFSYVQHMHECVTSKVIHLTLTLCVEYSTAAFKNGCCNPCTKKTNMDLDNLKNFHPISNLPFLAKILERIVASQLHTHLAVNNLFESR